MHSDPIADLLTRIRNGAKSKLTSIQVPHSSIKLEIVKILQLEGYVSGYEISTESKFPTIRINLKYTGRRESVIHHIRRISKPGLRVYKARDEIKPVRGGLATRILTTSSGVMTDRQARKLGIGGEVLCEIW